MRDLSNNVIPKEQLTAYQRWEMAPIDDDVEAPAPSVADEPEPVSGGGPDESGAHLEASDTHQENLPYPTAEEMESIHQQAYQEAFGEGQKEGFEKGFEQGLSEGRLTVTAEAERLKSLLNEIADARRHLDAEMSEDILKFGLELAAVLVRRSLAVRPELVLAVVREAVASLPAATQSIRLIVSPLDANSLREALSGEIAAGWTLQEDESVTPGGCRVESASSQVDATIETRWKRLLASLGQQGDWVV